MKDLLKKRICSEKRKSNKKPNVFKHRIFIYIKEKTMTLIEKIKALFAAPIAEAKFLDAKLVDGTVIRTDAEEFKVGDQLYVITEAGEKVNAPEGMHELEDGTVIVVDAEGKITEVRKPEVAVEEAAVEPKKEEMADAPAAETEAPTQDAAEGDAVKMLEERVTKLEEALMMLLNEMDMKKTEMSSVKAENEALKLKNEELSKAPIVKPTETKRFEKIMTESNKQSKVNADLLGKISAIRNK